MTVNWSLYETLLGGSSAQSDRRGVAIEQAAQSFVTGMVDDPAYQPKACVDGAITPILASRKSTIKCEIKAAPGTDIHIGDMVRCLGEIWIVVELYTDKVGIINGTMWLCNDIIRFQNHSAPVISRHCVVDDGSYSKRTDSDAPIMTNTYSIYITIDEATRKLYVDKRLAFGKVFSASGEEILEVYKIIGMDIKSKNFGDGSHLMVLTVQRDVYDAYADSIDDNICDIFVTNDEHSPAATGSCFIVGRDIIRAGVARTYVAKFTDANGKEVDGVSAVWQVTAPNAIKWSADGNNLTVQPPLDESIVGEVITINLTDAEGLFGAYEKKAQVVTVG